MKVYIIQKIAPENDSFYKGYVGHFAMTHCKYEKAVHYYSKEEAQKRVDEYNSYHKLQRYRVTELEN